MRTRIGRKGRQRILKTGRRLMRDSITTNPLTDSISKTRSNIEKWRSTKRPREPMPEDLWRQTAELASTHGINRIAKALRLDYYSLKKRVIAEAGAEKKAPEFVEILSGVTPFSRPEFTMELEDGCGAKLRITIKNAELPDISALARTFREAGK
jgi:hypothetical protein